MKTRNVIFVLSVTLIFIGITAAFSTKVDTRTHKTVQNMGIVYQVNIHSGFSAVPCNTYLVEVVDETGKLVAPPQVYNPTVKGYSFTQLFATEQTLYTRRVAMLVRIDYPIQIACSYVLYATPAVREGTFLPGRLYIFDLFPVNQSYNIN